MLVVIAAAAAAIVVVVVVAAAVVVIVAAVAAATTAEPIVEVVVVVGVVIAVLNSYGTHIQSGRDRVAVSINRSTADAGLGVPVLSTLRRTSKARLTCESELNMSQRRQKDTHLG